MTLLDLLRVLRTHLRAGLLLFKYFHDDTLLEDDRLSETGHPPRRLPAVWQYGQTHGPPLYEVSLSPSPPNWPLFSWIYSLFGPRIVWSTEISLIALVIVAWYLFYGRMIPFADRVEKKSQAADSKI